MSELKLEFIRSFPLLDISVRSDGDGRTVEAYAAVYESPTEISDMEGRYLEQMSRTSFNQAIARKQNYPVMFNHGKTMYGTPSDRWSAPIGVTSSLRSDGKGLVSTWRADATLSGDEALEMIKSGSVSGQSFSGRFTDSTPKVSRSGRYAADRNGNLQLVTRNNVFLRELGPTPFPAYSDATISGVRSITEQQLLRSGFSAEQCEELLTLMRAATPLDEAGQETQATSTTEPGAEDQPEGHSARHAHRSLRKQAREMEII